MKKLLAMLLALVMCLSLPACGGTPSTPDEGSQGNPQNDNTDDAHHAQEFTDILCSVDWDCRDWDSVLHFNVDGTVRFHYGKNEEDGIRTWEFDSYLNSFDEFTAMLQHDPEFSEKYGVYCGSMEQYGQILLGCNEDGSYKMYFNGKFWDPAA